MQILPLLALSLLVYAGMTFVSSASVVPWHEAVALTIPMISGDTWQISGGHLFLMVSMLLLFIELLRATRTHSSSIMNHALSVIVFIAALLLFLLVRGYGNSTFFLFVAMTLLDFMAGFIITTVTSRRDLSLGRLAD